MKRASLGVAVVAVAALASSSPAIAAAPDGLGPWADTVVSAAQGKQRNGIHPVISDRSDPASALGVAERSDAGDPGPGVIYSLGFGGTITLGFDNYVCNRTGDDLGLELVEGTHEPYPDERVDVYVSKDGSDYQLIASGVNKDANVGLPAGLDYVRFVRLVDVTPFEGGRYNADGYDVDGVQSLASNDDCTPPPPPPPVPDGKIYGFGTIKLGYRNSFSEVNRIYCKDGRSDVLAASWGHWHTFVLKSVTERSCTDDPAISPAPPAASFDTVTGKGTGWYDGKSGATVEFTLTDAGEPGRHDRVKMIVRDKNGNVVLDVDDTLDCGNHQAINLPAT